MRKALIETATGLVANVVELEDGANWQPPAGHHVRDADNASPGDTWDGVGFVPRPPSAEELATTKRKEARVRAMQAIKDNATQSPWGRLLYDLAVAQGWIEPE